MALTLLLSAAPILGAASDEDFAAHVRYCWINPFKHGVVEKPEDWPYSSVHRDIREGRYGW